MKMNKNVIAGVSATALVSAVIASAITSKVVDDSAVVAAQAETISQVSAELATLKTVSDEKVLELSDKLNTVGLELADLRNVSESDKNVIEDLEAQVIELNTPIARADSGEIVSVEDTTIGSNVASTTLDSNDLAKLYDIDVDYDGEEYNLEESITISDMKVVKDSSEFEGADVAVEFSNEGAIAYSVDLDGGIVLVADEELKVPFLNSQLSIKNVTADNELELQLASEYFLKVGESVEVEGKNVTLVAVADDEAYFNVDGEQVSIDEDDNEKVNGIRIEVLSAFDGQIGDNFAKFNAGEKLTETIKSGDEYEADEDYKWVIEADLATSTVSKVGLVYDVELTDNDEVLKVGDSFSFADDFVKFTVVEAEDYTYLNVDVTTDISDEETVFKFGEEVRVTVGDDSEKLSTISVLANGTFEFKDDVFKNLTDATFKYEDREFSIEKVNAVEFKLDGIEFKTSDDKINATIVEDEDVRTDFGNIVLGDEEDDNLYDRLSVKLISEQLNLNLDFE